MSVVAWDGKSLAIDSQSSCGNLRMDVQKWQEIKTENLSCIAAWVGDHSYGLQLVDWLKGGLGPGFFPKAPEHTGWTTLIMASKSGIFVYENMPVAVKTEEPFHAWGIGRDFAIGAMAMGANAEEAVRITCRFDINCGGKIKVARILG